LIKIAKFSNNFNIEVLILKPGGCCGWLLALSRPLQQKATASASEGIALLAGPSRRLKTGGWQGKNMLLEVNLRTIHNNGMQEGSSPPLYLEERTA
jgi:hypothetical protein